MNFNALYRSYEGELRDVEAALARLFSSSASLIPTIGFHIIKGGGKRIRPLFLLAASDTFGYNDPVRIVLASVLEAIHTASLLHDDVVDAALMRRGRSTANSLWGNQVVVLVGDFLYSNALREAVMQRSQAVMERLSEATTRMTEGELMQLSKSGDPDITEDEYLGIISGKTGALFSAACAIGGIVAGAKQEQVEALAEFGLKVGMVFQMTDDILDYSAEQVLLGKKLGKDMEEGKLTLPLILLFKFSDETERGELRAILSSKPADFEKSLSRVLHLFKKYSILERSTEKAAELVRSAQQSLSLIGSPAETKSLRVLADYSLKREK